MKRLTFFKRRASGQSFAEFALILPVLFTLLAGTIDLGRFFLSYMELRDAAQEGVNYASIYANSDPSTAAQFVANVTGRVQSSAQYPLKLSAVTVNVTPSSGLCTGANVKVTDLGRLYVERHNAQSAADSAAFAAAVAKIKNQGETPSDLQTAITAAAVAAAQTNGFSASTVSAHYPPLRPGKPYDGDLNYVQVIIQSKFNPFFAQLIGIHAIPNTSEAVVLADSHASILGGDLI